MVWQPINLLNTKNDISLSKAPLFAALNVSCVTISEIRQYTNMSHVEHIWLFSSFSHSTVVSFTRSF
jgi:hypothetical protein